MRREQTIGVSALLVLALLGGCAQTTSSENKKAAYDRWSQARTGILYSLAVEQFQSGDLDTAYQSCKEGMSASPRSAEFFELAGRVMLERSQLELAHKFITRAIELNDSRAQSHYVLGVIYQRWQQYDKALTAFERSAELEGDDVSALLATADMLVKLDRCDQALQRLTEKLTAYEHSAAIRTNIGRLYMMNRQFDKAVDMYRQAKLLSPDDTSITEHLAFAEMAAGNFIEAIYHIKRLEGTEDYIERPDLKLALVDCYLSTDNPVQAGRVCVDLTKDHPDNIGAWIRLGQAAFVIGENEVLQRAADQLTRLAPDRYEGYMLHGMAAQRKGEDPMAVLYYTQATQLSPKDNAPWMMLGMAEARLGHKDKAEAAYRKALAIAPQDARPKTLLSSLTNTQTP